ncbi:lytic transglycosylase [Roseivivax halodurans JCM 10272]|uniref:Lytic transglycosylase n=1 Tax=Roseivivax halodurans JCM 10272 TaxID=1449350 RepID=X7EI69_9RHOB|nr:transglycosylase SLT domain-containing protein [Roseivivax halodurans]ETX15617.1 lytic transglycosylase [Roseivivax halodurans JCM 10272]
MMTKRLVPPMDICRQIAVRTRSTFGAIVVIALCAAPVASTAQAPAEYGPKLRPGQLTLPRQAQSEQAVPVSLRPKMRDDRLPTARWGGSARGTMWTRAMVNSLRGPAAPLTDIVPRDIDEWCPGYVQNDRRMREAFWVGLVSALAKHESTYRPTVVGGGGRWHGLLQILPSTARLYGCQAQSGDALKSGAANLSCGLRIMARTVSRDGVVSRGMRGVAADWGPFHSSAKREDMMNYTRTKAFCQPAPSTRPQLRPERPQEPVVASAPHPARTAATFGVISSTGHLPR